MGVPVILRVLPDGELQQRQILRPAFLRVRIVLQHDLRTYRCLPGALPVCPPQHFMYRMMPAEHAGGVDFLLQERSARRSAGAEAPDIGVPELFCSRLPGILQQLPPAGPKHLVQVRAHADVRVRRDQLHGAVAGRIKPPGADSLLPHHGAPVRQLFHGPVRAPGVQHAHPVRLPHGVHPAVHELLFVFGDGVHADFHGCLLVEKRAEAYLRPLRVLLSRGALLPWRCRRWRRTASR